jgi:hypothetical protein
MPQLMPYHLEKGPTIRLLEQHLNGTADEMRAMLDGLRASPGSVAWVLTAIPGLWDDARFNHSPLGSGAAVRDNLLRDWFGFEESGGAWVPEGGDTTGYWIAYQGDVNEIVRRTLQWALEQSLGIAPGEKGPGRDDPWPIEIFWKCPSPWFEGWVVTRPVDGRTDAAGSVPGASDSEATGGDGCVVPRRLRLDDRRHRWPKLIRRRPGGHGRPTEPATEPESAGAGDGTAPRGLVSVFFLTPSHLGANVAESPIAHSSTTMPPGVTHAIPSWQDDYEVLGEAHPDPAGFPDRPVVPAIQRTFSSWIVTHRDHVTTGAIDVTVDTAAAADFADWGIPQLSIYAGQGEVVIVSPSVPAGGVPADGEV